MKLHIDPEAKFFLRTITFASLRLAIPCVIALALGSLLLPWLPAKVLMIVPLIIGGLLAILTFARWGSASCLADLFVWVLISLVGMGSVGARIGACLVLRAVIPGAGRTAVSTTCGPDYQRAAAGLNIATLALAGLAVWLMVRYYTARAPRGQG
jgi:hypothetical protein